MKQTTNWKRLALLASAAMGCLAASQAAAQTAQSAPHSDPSSESTVGEVVVTGTLIRGLTAPTGSNLVAVSSKQIEATGATNAIELLNKTVPQLPTFNAVSVGSAGWGTPVTKLGLRGFGNTAGTNSGATGTLILFNGHRVVPVGILSTDPDPELIPADALDAVQVMPDGGSATYGSDAIGGVINFVTRKRFQGVQLHVQESLADHYNETNVSLVAGKSWDTGSLMLSAVHVDHDAVLGRDRDYINANFTSHGGVDYRATGCPFGSFAVGGAIYAAPGFSQVASRPRCDQSDYSTLVPDEKRNTVFGYVEQNLTENLKFSMDAFYSERRSKIFTDTATIPVSMTITGANPFFHPVAGETSQTVSFNYARAIGPALVSPQTFKNWQFSPSLAWTVNENWNIRGDFIYGKSTATIHDRTGVNGAAVNATNFNPYDPALSDPAVIAALRNYELFSEGVNTLASGQLVVDGKLFDLPGGAVKIAVGGEWRRQKLRDSTFTGPIGSRQGVRTFPADRTIKAGFAELFVPIVGEPNAMPGVQELSLDIALRRDDYSDFGGTTNPRFGLNYRPFKDLLLRANYQTTFNAPSLADSGNKVDTRFQILTVTPNNYLVFIAGAGTGVKPATGKTFSVGGDWTPSAIPGLKVSATYWNTRLDDFISQALGAYGGRIGASRTAFNLCGAGSGTISASAAGPCTPAFLNGIQDIWVRIDNGAAPGINSIADLFAPGVNVAAVIDARRANFGSEKISGVDFDVAYSWDMSIGRAFAELAGTYMLNKEIAPAAGAPFVDYLSGAAVTGATPRLNIIGTLGLTHGPFSGRLTVSHNSGYDIPVGTVVGQSHVGSFTLADISLTASLGGFAAIKENQLELSVSNIFDTDPPYYGAQGGNSQNQLGFANGGTLGRLVRVGLRSKF